MVNNFIYFFRASKQTKFPKKITDRSNFMPCKLQIAIKMNQYKSIFANRVPTKNLSVWSKL